jgi:hypothetical protein
MRLKSISVILISLIGLSAKLWACGPDTSYSWTDEAEAPYFFSLALAELKEIESSPPCQAAAASPEMAQAEMLRGWFSIIDDLPSTEQAKYDMLYLLNRIPMEQLEFFKKALGNASQDFKSFHAFIRRSNLPSLNLSHFLTRNLALGPILRNKNMAALDYLIFMNELNETGILDSNRESWDYQAYTSKGNGSRDASARLAAQALKGYKLQKNPELKWRYAFQLTRLYFYQRDYQSLIDFFVREIAPKPYHPVKEWCRSFYGGALAAQNKLTAAIKEFALVSHRSAYYQASARLSLKSVLSRATEADQVTAVAMARDEVEAAIIRSVLNYQVKSNHYLSLLTTLALVEQGVEIPISLENDLVLAIGHLEKNGYKESKNDSRGAAQLPTKELERLILAIAPKRDQPAFWYLGAAHMAILRGGADKAQEYIDLATASGADTYLPRQLALTKLLQAAYLEPLDARGEDIIGQRLREVDKMRFLNAAKAGDNSAECQMRPALTEATRGVLEIILGARYQAAGRNDRAFSCLAVSNDWLGGNKNGDFFHVKDSFRLEWPWAYVGLVLADPEAIKGISRTILNPQGQLEKFFARYAEGWTPTVLTELLGMAYIFRHEFTRASQALADLDSGHKTWAESRYKLKTPGNPFKYSPTDIFGRAWQDDFKNFFEKAAAVSSEKELQTLAQTIHPPTTFFEFATQADKLADLSQAEGELGLAAAYFKALSLYNIHIFPYWDQGCSRKSHGRDGWWCPSEDLDTQWATTYKSQPSYYTVEPVFGAYTTRGNALRPDPVDDEIKPLLLRVIRQTKNPELAARANFFLAGLGQIGNLSWNYRTDAWDIDSPEKFMPYYRALNNYRNTAFVKAMNFNCPLARNFLDSAKPAPSKKSAARPKNP